jgi:hypothetical protein
VQTRLGITVLRATANLHKGPFVSGHKDGFSEREGRI